MSEIVIDGENEILGRVAGYAAKKALQGDKIVVVNCNKILISGNRDYIINSYTIKRRRGAVRFPSVPEKIMKRTIRGMINYKSGRGQIAFKNIMCYSDVPEKYKNSEKIKLGNKNLNLMTLGELGKSLKQGRNG